MIEIESYFLQLLISTIHRNCIMCNPKHAYMGTESPTPPTPKKHASIDATWMLLT